MSGRRAAKTIRACGRVAALQGRIHDCKRRVHRRRSKLLARRGRSIHVVLFEEQGSDQTGDGGLVGKDADDFAASLDLAVEPLQRVGGVQPGAMLGGEAHVGEHIDLGLIHEGGEFGHAGPGLIGDVTPLLAGGGGIVLGEGGADPGGDDAALGLAGVGQGVAHEMDAAALPGRPQDPGDGGLQPLVRVRDHQLDAPEAAAGKRAQKLDPERLGLAVTDGHAQHLAPAVGVDADGDDDRDRDDVMVAPGFDIGGVEPDVGPVALDRAAEEGLHPLVYLRAEPRDLALADALHAHGAHQVVDRAGRDALDIGFLDHRGQGLLGQPPGLEEDREVAAAPQLGDAQLDRAGPGLPIPVAVAVVRIPTIATTDSDGSRPPVPIDRDQCGAGACSAVGC